MSILIAVVSLMCLSLPMGLSAFVFYKLMIAPFVEPWLEERKREARYRLRMVESEEARRKWHANRDAAMRRQRAMRAPLALNE